MISQKVTWKQISYKIYHTVNEIHLNILDCIVEYIDDLIKKSTYNIQKHNIKK